MMVANDCPGVSPGPRDLKSAEVWRCLGQVVDPELDEPVTELDFVTHVDVDESDGVKIGFRLPTYWCAPNFAFMMVDDLRSAARGLPWVKAVSVELGEHMYADTINQGVALNQTFQEAFGDEADGNLDEVRRTFLLKAFQRRQEALLHRLNEWGCGSDEIVNLTVGDLQRMAAAGDGLIEPAKQELVRLVARYLQRRSVPGPFDDSSKAFVTTADEALQIEGFLTYVKGLRRVRVNAEFNGALCRGLLAVRFDTATPLPSKSPVSPRHG